ncbi:MAG: amidohydrolase family protein [Chitinophagales bacterium]
MKSPIFLSIFLFSLLLFSCNNEQTSNTSTASNTPKTDLILYNGTIYTADENLPKAEAIAVKDGEITFVGSNADIQSWIPDAAKVVDLEGKTVLPGFIESHGHLLGLGRQKTQLELANLRSYEQLVDLVAEAVKTAKKGEWILGRGWHQSKWEKIPNPSVKGFQTHELLSVVSPDNPVFLTHASGHAGFANAKAMKMAGITSETTFPEDGEIMKDADGNPTGIFVENAEQLITKIIPESTPETDAKALQAAVEECLKYGITSFQDAGSEQKDIDLYKNFLSNNQLKIRLYVMLAGWAEDDSLLQKWYAKGPEIGLGDNHLTIRSIKMYADGALGSRGAWLLDEYSDRPAHFGNNIMDMEAIYKTASNGLQNGFQVCTHAIGDKANREVLNQYEKAFAAYPEAAKNARFRIEHAQHLSLEDIPRFGELGIIASIQGIHMASDRPWAIDRLGKKRIEEGAYVWQKLLQSGAKVINGTDTPVEPVNPFACFYASVTRQTLAGTPEGGYEADQKMTREQALKTYTLDAAYGSFEEDIKGSIEVGKLADFVVLDKDLMQIPVEQILRTKVVYTIVGGEIVFEGE